MKLLFLTAVLCLALILCACTNLSVPTSSKIDIQASGDINQALPQPSENSLNISKISLSKEMDISDIDFIVPCNSNTVYILGRKKGQELAKDENELVLAVYNIETAVVHVLYRGPYRTNNIENMAVYRDEDGIDTVFTGQKMFVVNNGKLVSMSNWEKKCQREAFVNLKHKKMVYVDSETLDMYYFDMETEDNTLIYEAEAFASMEESRAALYPYNVRLSGDSNKILYQTARGNAMFYEHVITTSPTGKNLSKTDLLPVKGLYLNAVWYEDGFITIETTDQSNSAPLGMATFFTQYDSMGKVKSSLSVECLITAMQPKFYENNPWLAFEHQTDETKILSLYNAIEEKIYNVHKSDNYFVSPTVTPNGKRVLWAENEKLCYMEVRQ
ncbi:MAG: hypothetical protein RSF86_08790 [Angelakisella sp.]